MITFPYSLRTPKAKKIIRFDLILDFIFHLKNGPDTLGGEGKGGQAFAPPPPRSASEAAVKAPRRVLPRLSRTCFSSASTWVSHCRLQFLRQGQFSGKQEPAALGTGQNHDAGGVGTIARPVSSVRAASRASRDGPMAEPQGSRLIKGAK